jgi:hypothetical protein
MCKYAFSSSYSVICLFDFNRSPAKTNFEIVCARPRQFADGIGDLPAEFAESHRFDSNGYGLLKRSLANSRSDCQKSDIPQKVLDQWLVPPQFSEIADTNSNSTLNAPPVTASPKSNGCCGEIWFLITAVLCLSPHSTATARLWAEIPESDFSVFPLLSRVFPRPVASTGHSSVFGDLQLNARFRALKIISFFTYCGSMGSLCVPGSVTELDSFCFENCDILGLVTFEQC